MGRNKAITQYLQRYGEPLQPFVSELMRAIPNAWRQASVIPAYKEGDGFVHRLRSAPHTQGSLFVLVLNGPADLSDAARDSTLRALWHLQATGHSHWEDSRGFLHFFMHNDSGFLVANLLQPPSPHFHQYGVGYARKLGTDLCLHLYASNLLQSPWVRSTDADVIWPEEYFLPLQAAHGCSAQIFPFRHDDVDDSLAPCRESAALYDSWLRYYVAGLQWSGSPWAFHTVGSTLAIHLHHYAMNRGFPKREAGEDFYLLNKLAKTGNIQHLQHPVLHLSNRISDRTPFGTGISVGRITEQESGDWSWPFYHPAIFSQLKIWHEWLPRLHGQDNLPQALTEEPVFAVLQDLGLHAALQHCRRQCRDAAAFARHLWQWFDAATTRKCIHLLRDRLFGTLRFTELRDLIRAGDNEFLVFLQGTETAPTTPLALSQLLIQREHDRPHPCSTGLRHR